MSEEASNPIHADVRPPRPRKFNRTGLIVYTMIVSSFAYHFINETWLGTLQCTGLFLLGAVSIFLCGGPKKMNRSATRRIIALGIFIAASAALYPAFREQTFPNLSAWREFGLIFPIVSCVFIWLLGSLKDKVSVEPLPNDSAEKLEQFLSSPSARFNLFLLSLIAFPALTSLSGLPMISVLWQWAWATALLLALKPLFILARTEWGAEGVNTASMGALLLAAVLGIVNYTTLRSDANLAVEQMDAGKPEEAAKTYERAVALSGQLHATGPRLDLERAIARHFETLQNYAAAEKHWENVSRLLKVNSENFLPLQRVRCAQGDGLPAWRRLVYDGFPSIGNPEIAPGIVRLGEIATDVRGRLLAALLAWEQNAPEAQRRKLLEAVQQVSSGEPTSFNLLKRIHAPVKDVPLWLPAELLVGKAQSLPSLEGLIEDLGEVSTLVYLNEGKWEMSLRAIATPLHEAWPVVRVELNGQILGPTQVNKSVEHDVPFTFEVTRKDIYKLRIVFQNHEEDIEGGRAARRGLKILGLKFSQAVE